MTRVTLASLSAAAVAAALWMLLTSIRPWAQALRHSQERTLERHFTDSLVQLDPARFAQLCVCAAVLLGMATWLFTRSPLVAAASAALSLGIPSLIGGMLRRRRLRRLRGQLPDAVELLASSLQSGLGLQPALQHLTQYQRPPLQGELELVFRKQRLGMSFDQAFEQLGSRIGGEESMLLVAALNVGRQTGGNLSLLLRRIAQTMREREQVERKIQALTAQSRLQARVVGALPLVLLLAMYQLEPRAMHLMHTTPQGWMVIGMLGFLEGAGFLLLRQLMRIDP